MKRLLLTIVVLFTAITFSLAADNTASLWQKANEQYAQKQYDAAAQYYEEIAASKPRNAVLYYNLGNTYYRLNRIGLAVLNYERAINIDPDYKEARENLYLTQNRMSNRVQSVDDIFFVQWWNVLTSALKERTWAIASLLTFIGIIAMLLYNRLKSPASRRIPGQVPGVLAFIWLCFIVLAMASAHNSKDTVDAVVMQNDAPLMSMDQKGKPLSLLPEGTVVRIRSIRGDYLEVRLTDGRIGWLQQSFINKI